jgi:hypothetical protein
MQIPGISSAGSVDSSPTAAATSSLAMTSFGIPLTGSSIHPEYQQLTKY